MFDIIVQLGMPIIFSNKRLDTDYIITLYT